MDVNAISRNKDYVDKYSNVADQGKYSTPVSNEDGKVKITTVEKDGESQELLNKDQDKAKREELDKAVSKLNKFLEDEKVHAEYSVHKDLGTIMIKIVDDSDKVVLELPPEKILDMVASMCKQVGLLDKKA